MARIIQFFKDLASAFMRWQDDDGWLMAAGTAYYLGISFFPMLIVLIAGLSYFLEFTHVGSDARQRVLETISQNASPQLAEYVEQALRSVQQRSSTSGPLSLLGLLVASLAAFAQLDAAFDRIWNVPSKSSGVLHSMLDLLIGRGRALLLLLGLGSIVVIVFIAGIVVSTILTYMPEWLPLGQYVSRATQLGISFAVNFLVFALMHKWLPKTRVPWRSAILGGLLTAVFWEIGRQVLSLYIGRAGYASAYGVIGAFLSVLLWCYYAIIIILIAAEWVQIKAERQTGKTADEMTADSQEILRGKKQHGTA